MDLNNTSNTVKTITYSKGLEKDLNDSAISDQVVTHARNAMLSTQKGDVPFYSNEMSNLLCITLPYKYNGNVKLTSNRYLLFSSDNTSHEIGIGNLDDCSYTKLIDNSCLKLNNNYIVTGIVKLDSDGNEIVLFNDALNDTRILNLSNIPKTYTVSSDDCKTKNYTNQLDCEDLKLFPVLSIPCLSIIPSNTGLLPNGTYSVGIAYSVNDIKFSDVYSITTPIFINNGRGDSSIVVNISNLDLDFPQYKLYLIGTVDGITTPKLVGTYSTSQEKVIISKWEDSEFTTISNLELVTSKKNYTSAGIIANNSQYAMLADLTHKREFNVQKLSGQVTLDYIVKRYPENYYKVDGTDIGHYRDENYRYYLRYIDTQGEPTKSGLIYGPKAKESDFDVMSGDNVYERSVVDSCETLGKVLRWQVENTASPMKAVPFKKSTCGFIVGTGTFGYAESTQLLPDDKEVYGDEACQKIRLHKYPDECKVPRFTVDEKTGQRYINILGFKAKNIPYPRYDDNTLVPNIVGYEILRSKRDSSNKTVVSRGMLSNMRGYEEKTEGEILYSNYPYNDLTPDQFISKKQVYKNNQGVEKDFEPLDKVYQNKFTFFSPHNYFFEKYKIGTELKLETEESANVKGNFVQVFNHPKHKLMTNFALSIAALVGSLEAYLSFQGKTCTTTFPTTTDGTTNPKVGQSFVNVCDDSGKAIVPIPLNSANIGIKIKMAISNAAKVVLNSLSFLGIAADFANKFLDTVRSFSSFKQYVYQYNSYGLFTKQKCINHRGKINNENSRYLESAPENIGDFTINNYKKEKTLFLDVNKDIPFPDVKDTTRRSMTQFGLCKKINEQALSTASMYYGTIKVKNPSQYGSVNNTNVVKTHSCVLKINKEGVTNSPEIFGGDCIIGRFTVNRKQPLFKETLANKGFPDGTGLDYREHRIIGFPRFYADFTEYDSGNLMNLVGNVIKSPNANKIQASLPDQKHNLDCKAANGKKVWTVSNQYMYTSINGVLDFFAEADYNFTLQENDTSELYQPNYSSTTLERVFRSDVIDKDEFFKLDPSYKKIETNEVFTQAYTEVSKAPIREKNSIIYSLPAFTGQKFNNWQYFLPNNYFTFDERDFGELTGIHSLDQDRVIFLFSKSSPFVSMGRDQLETTSGRKITIGDGGLFAQQPRELIHTDVAYGGSLDKYAFRSTQFGHFYVSREQGKIFNFDNNLKEISREGLHFWCSKYMPLQITQDFPTYKFDDCPQTGIGYQIAFDNIYELVYISKRDYSLKEEYKNQINYDEKTNVFTFKNLPITLGDNKYFNNASWTLSYSPTNKAFSSFHDWHPDWIMQEDNHFSTIKGNSIYKHNVRCDSYCNFYGVDYPYEVEVTLNTGQQSTLLRSLEFHNEVYHNKNNCRDRFHMYEETFDQYIVYNSEQHSGIRNMEYLGDRTGSDVLFNYPKIENNGTLTVVYSKKEQHYRINMFKDLTKNRGQDLSNENQMWLTQSNGYIKDVNPLYLDINKPRDQQKYFRHYFHTLLLRRNNCGANNFITKYQNFKITNSSL